MYKISVPIVIASKGFNKEKVLSELRRCGAHRIALALEREVAKPYSSERVLNLLKELIEYYKENGFEVIVWLGETFGHTADITNGTEYTTIRHIDGEETGAFCPMDEKFTEDFCSWVKNVALCGADMIMLDDDFRLTARGTCGGCCCDLHMQALKNVLGEDIAVSELTSLICTGDGNKYRDAWIKVQADSLINFSKKIRAALDSINPEARLGFCASPDWFTHGGILLDLCRIMAGKTKPFLRTIGAPYWASALSQPLGNITEYERIQFEWCKNLGIELMAEGDAYPRPRYKCSAVKVEFFDMILRAAGGSDGILKYMLDYTSDTDYETGYIDAMVKNKPNYEAIERLFGDKNCIGVRPFNSYETFKTEYLPEDNKYNYIRVSWHIMSASSRFAAENSLPTAYDGDGVNIVFGENARYINPELLKNGNIIDIEAARVLIKLGYDVGIESFIEESERNIIGFSAVPNEYFVSENRYTRLEGCKDYKLVTTKPGTEILSYHISGDKKYPLAYLYENSDGHKFLVYTFNAEYTAGKQGWLYSYSRKRQLTEALERMGNDNCKIQLVGNFPYTYMLVKKNEKEISVGLWNIFEDDADNVKIKFPHSDFEINELVNCKAHKEGNYVVFDSTIGAYKFAAFSVKLG